MIVVRVIIVVEIVERGGHRALTPWYQPFHALATRYLQDIYGVLWTMGPRGDTGPIQLLAYEGPIHLPQWKEGRCIRPQRTYCDQGGKQQRDEVGLCVCRIPQVMREREGTIIQTMLGLILQHYRAVVSIIGCIVAIGCLDQIRISRYVAPYQ